LWSRKSTQSPFDASNRRKSNQKQPRATTKDISNFEHEGKAYEGIPWGPRHVIEAFDFLSDICSDRKQVRQVEDFPVPSEGAIISLTVELFDDDAESDIYGELPENALSWYEFDIADMRNDLATQPCPNRSWYARLKAVCDQTLIRLILLHQGQPNAEGGRQQWTDEFVSKNIQRVLTVILPEQAAAARQRPVPSRFPIDVLSLDAWRTDFEKFHVMQHSEPTEIEAKMQSVSRGEMAKVPPQTVKQSVDEAAAVPHHTLNELMGRHYDKTGTPKPEHLSPEQFGSVFTYPYAPLAPYQVDEFTEAFIGTNVYGQAKLMFSRIEAEYVRLQVLQAQISEDMKRLDVTGEQLIKQIKMYEEARRSYEKASQDYSQKQTETQELRDRYASLSGEQIPSAASRSSVFGPTRRSSFTPGNASRLDSPGIFGSSRTTESHFHYSPRLDFSEFGLPPSDAERYRSSGLGQDSVFDQRLASIRPEHPSKPTLVTQRPRSQPPSTTPLHTETSQCAVPGGGKKDEAYDDEMDSKGDGEDTVDPRDTIFGPSGEPESGSPTL
jgi:hypothetical protein